jgi:hypothetical protein
MGDLLGWGYGEFRGRGKFLLIEEDGKLAALSRAEHTTRTPNKVKLKGRQWRLIAVTLIEGFER